MNIVRIMRSEFRRLWSSTMSRLALVALAIVPLIYGGVYLWANHDPYASLDRVPAALVVADSGVSTGDGLRNIGRDVADSVLNSDTFDWRVLSPSDASTALERGDVEFVVTLPRDFTADLLSTADPHPSRASIELVTSDATGALTATMGENAAAEIRAQVVEQVGEEAASALLVGISDIRSGLIEAHDGAAQLTDALADAHDGAAELASGAHRLAGGAAQLESGAGSLSIGAAQVNDGAHDLADGLGTMSAQTQQLPQQTATLAAGAQQVADGNAQVAAIGAEAASVTDGLAAQVPDARADIIAALTSAGLSDEQIAQALVPLDQLGSDVAAGNERVQSANAQLQQLAAGSQQVADGAATLASASVTLTDGIQEAATGAGRLADGTQDLADGATQVAAGAHELATGAHQLADGTDDLESGTTQLHDGAAQLRDGLADGVAQIPAASENDIANQSSQIADSAAVDQSFATDAGSYGARLAPFFASLAAWIGIYSLMLIMKPASRRAMTALRSPVSVGLAAWLTPAVVGAFQMLALFGILVGLLGFPVEWPGATIGVLVLAAAVFAAILVALNVWLASVGQFLGLILMVVQLVTAGGTFPWQTLPAPLAALHQVLPMSASVDALRQAMTGGSTTLLWTSVAHLLAWGVLGVSAIVLGVWRQMDHRTMRDLQPSLIG